MSITFEDRTGTYIKQWPNWELGIPNSGDHVLLHWGDNNEVSVEYVVLHRTFDGTEPETVYCAIEKV
jgi:hypothetical protein